MGRSGRSHRARFLPSLHSDDPRRLWLVDARTREHHHYDVPLDVDTGLAATNLPWGWGEKHCTWSAGNSDKDACFAECSGTSGFKPPKLYQCYKDTNAATGKCEATGWFTDRREDWDVDLPWDVKRPTFASPIPGGRTASTRTLGVTGRWISVPWLA